MSNRALIIADIGINHNGNMKAAKHLINQAKLAGADIAKFQLYSTEKLFPDGKIMTQDRNWFDMVVKYELTKDMVKELKDHCDKNKIEFMASAFDLERLGWLEDIGVKRHKVATPVRNDKRLIDTMISIGKPIMLSTGSVNDCYFRDKFKHVVSLLYCIPEYPTELISFKFREIGFPVVFQGLSDHSVGEWASVCALARGALIIEKHLTIDRNDPGGPDHICSATPFELKHIVDYARKFEEIL